MSIETAGEFLKRLNTDTALQQKLEKLGEVDVEAMIKFADDEGYKFSASEFSQSIKAFTEELDEKSLEKVAAGFNPQPEPPGRLFLYSLLGRFI